MKKATVIIIALLVISGITQTASAQGISEFMNQTVNVDGHGVQGSLKMWQSLLALATPVVLMAGAVVVGYVKYKIAESKKALKFA